MFVFAVFPLAGCGGKSNTSGSGGVASSASSGTHTTQPAGPDQRFVVQADAICRAANTRLARSDANGKTAAEVAASVVANETIERKTAGELAKLTPPAALLPAWKKMLGYRRSLAAGLGDLAVAVKRENKASFPALAKSKKKLHGSLRATARQAGFKDCAEVG